VKYKVLIKKCGDPQTASRIAEEIARWSGSTADVVYNVITQKPVCIRKEAEREEALRLKGQFEAVGAEVELVAMVAELRLYLNRLLNRSEMMTMTRKKKEGFFLTRSMHRR
jgi:hypothetical protein